MNKDHKGAILREQVRLAMQQLPTMLVTNLICASVLALAAWKIAAPGKILLWISMVLAIHLSRSVLYFEFRKARDASFNGERWQDLYLASNLISGVVWGASAFLIFPSIGYPGRIFIFLLVIVGVAAASTVSHSTLRLGPVAWSGPAVMAYAVRCRMDGGRLGYTIGMLGVLFLFTVIIYGLKHNRFITSGIVLRFENLELLEEVRTVNDTISLEIAERKLAQKALEESEEKFRLAFQTSPDAIYLSRVSDGMCIDINDGFTKLTGYTRDDVIGKTSQELNIRHDPKGRVRFRAHLKQRIRGKHGNRVPHKGRSDFNGAGVGPYSACKPGRPGPQHHPRHHSPEESRGGKEKARGGVVPRSKDGVCGTAGRRGGARFQQHAQRDHRTGRNDASLLHSQ